MAKSSLFGSATPLLVYGYRDPVKVAIRSSFSSRVPVLMAKSSLFGSATPLLVSGYRDPVKVASISSRNLCFLSQCINNPVGDWNGRKFQPVMASDALFAEPCCKTVVIALSDTRNLSFLAKELQNLGYSIISTGESAREIEEAGIPVTRVKYISNISEKLDGNVKAVYDMICGDILLQREEHDIDIGKIDLVVTNLFPSMIGDNGNIDIDGIILIETAVEKGVLVIVDSEDYPALIDFLRGGQVDKEFRESADYKALRHVASYQKAISAMVLIWKKLHAGKGKSTTGDTEGPSQI